ncbi:MAG: CoA-transferase [Rhodospirillales bacterium]|jgi:glutaconate CoA-transferase subunit A|nr:3-oxoadipate CoA-transferase [Rhodospirillaceae bacterium]MDP6426433.1 CoA-transferase [Rhodospirillales bacterium]MDP6643679.1 CoA-transferase [Rhodospirillales bacterium]MDP6840354.1 CoA-transferase [Rhodospirillales bacterium]|tara:strand:- start:376 stop:1299 length:924 start_codon:yes stop_codon:yes gene_type:complete
MQEKLMDLKEAVASFVKDGDSIILGAALENAIPFAATHELIRAGLQGLNMVAPISDMSSDMLIGAGCVAEVTGSWVGNVSAGLGHNYRRAAENGVPHPIKINDYSNFTIGMALFGGAYGLPYIAVKSLLGSDIPKSNPLLQLADNPFTEGEDPVVLIPALKPDVAFLTMQRADRYGNAHYWGSYGLTQESSIAAEKIIVLADEIVEPEVIASDPSRVVIPGFGVNAVCHVPAACHPSPLIGRWKRDNEFFHEYHKQSRDPDGFNEWCREWVLDLPDHAAYRAKLGARLEKFRIRGEALSAPANYAAE